MTGWLEGASQAPPGQRCHLLEEDAKGTVAGGVTWATLPSVLCHGKWGCSGDGGRGSATHTAVAPLHASPGLEERGQEALC